MTKEELLEWALENYFDSWEMENALTALKAQGMDAAVEVLRKRAMDGCRGHCGPDWPAYNTGSGKIELYLPETRIINAPDMVLDIAWFCRRKLESLYQPKLL